MKNLLTPIAVFLLAAFLVQAQPEKIQKIFDKYSGKEGFTTVKIKDFSSLIGENEQKGDEQNEILSKICGVKILSFENNEEKNKALGKEFTEDLNQLGDIKDFTEFLSVQEKNTNVRILFCKEEKGLKGLLIIAAEEDSSSLIWVCSEGLKLEEIDKFGKYFFHKGIMDGYKGK